MSLPELVKSYQVVHQTGKGKNNLAFRSPNYHPFELISFAEYAAVLNAAHLVVARAGLSTLAELSALGKAAIIVPMPNSHQEDNARILLATNSAEVLMGKFATAQNLIKLINHLKFDPKAVEILSQNIKLLMPKDAAGELAKLCLAQNDQK